MYNVLKAKKSLEQKRSYNLFSVAGGEGATGAMRLERLAENRENL